jgi:glycosyltransferase involved in cell wall biosynthesis
VIRVLHMMEGPDPGGAETILVELATHLGEGFESEGLVLVPGWIHSTLGERGIPTHTLPLERSFDLSWSVRLARLVRARGIDLIQSHEFTTNCYATLAARLARVPIACTVHGKVYYPGRYYRRAAYRWTARTADAFVAVSEDLARFLHRALGIPERRLRVILNGVDLSRFGAPATGREAARAAVRAELGLPADAFVALTVAALFEVKAHADLIDAAAVVLKARPGTVFLFVGEGPLEDALKVRAERLGVGKNIRFLGFRRDVPELLAASDAFVLPSLSEGLPVSVIEASAAGLPVVATDVGGTGEVVADGETGLLVPPRQPERLAAALGRLAADRAEARRLGEAGRERARTRFGLERMVADYRHLSSDVAADERS